MILGFQEEKPTAMSVFFRLVGLRGSRLRGICPPAPRGRLGRTPGGVRPRGAFALLLAACVLLAPAGPAFATGPAKAPRAAATPPAPPPLRIGEISPYKALPDYSVPYRRGWMLALEQINAEGGVLGRKLEVRSRDDHGDPDDAVQAARVLVEKDGVAALFGAYSSEVGLALSRYADTAKVLYLAVSRSPSG